MRTEHEKYLERLDKLIKEGFKLPPLLDKGKAWEKYREAVEFNLSLLL